jgi:hypothetical protein
MSRNEIFGAQSVHEQMMQPSLERLEQELGFDIPVETVPLPSQGKAYDQDHPLYNTTTVDIRAMTAREEDILTSRALIKNGTVISHLIQSCMVTKGVDVRSLLSGDRNALMIAVRITGYGADYNTDVACPACTAKQVSSFTLSDLEVKPLEIDPVAEGQNAFEFVLPVSGKKIQFKFANGYDEEEATTIAERRKKQGLISENLITDMLTRAIIAIDGDEDKSKIASFVRYMPARDSLALRNYINDNEPGVNTNVTFKCTSCDHEEDIALPMGVNFFWPTT